ncbi:hypothetical protein [Citrobacter freundii]|uniref:hypothetical protein n=1 Tax=Citrobacter freundii TaxID=546 RepID=UPI00193BC366|nr:hypothetical protein [Citrobacter freundii]MBM3008254.1 hypothetical protein [Citrobacter freundii]
MARENKFVSSGGAKDTPPWKLMEMIVEDVITAKTMTFAQWHALSENPFAPLAIPVSQGRQYRVTQAGVDAAHLLSQQSWKSREALRQTIDRVTFTKLSFLAIGDTLLDCQSRLPTVPDGQNEHDVLLGDDFYMVLADDYQARLQQLAASASPDVDRHIPCHLFHSDQAVPAFAVGPVRFLPRAEWLDSFVKDSEVRELVRQVEDRELDMEELTARSAADEGGRYALHALDVLHTLRHYSWVATIRMDGHEHTRSHFKASVVVGLAIDSIGLRFQVEDARRFTKAGRQHLFAEDRFATTLDGRILRGSSVQMPGLGGRPGALAAKMAGEQSFLDAAGCILQHYADGRRTGHALHLVERWANALYWVGEARREASDFMAVVDYGCAADALSGAGGSAKDMTAFAETALKPEDEPVPEGALTVDTAVHKVYREGRNKLAHGEMSGLLEDLAEPRAVGEALLSALFDVVTPVLADLLRNEPNLPKLDEKRAYRLLEAKLAARKASA